MTADHVDSTAGPGDDVLVNLDLQNFNWVGQNGDFCVGPLGPSGGCVSGRTERADHGGFEWTIAFRPIEVCDGVDNDGNGLVDDGTGSCLQRFAFIPVCWSGTQAQFNNAVQAQVDFFLQASDIGQCSNNVFVEKLPLSAGFCPAESPTDTKFQCGSNILAGVSPAFAAAGFDLADFDMVIGATDQDKCENIAGQAGGAILWTETDGEPGVLAHEFGHSFVGLGEEYCSQIAGGGLSCNSNADVNFLDPALGCNPDRLSGGDCCDISIRPDPMGATPEQPCAGPFSRCCQGNLAMTDPPSDLSNNTAGGRCIMSYASAPGPRGWCRHCWDALKGAGLSCDAVFGGAGHRMVIPGRILEDGTLEVHDVSAGFGRFGLQPPPATSPYVVELRDASNNVINSIGAPLNHGFAHEEVGFGGDVLLRIPFSEALAGTAMPLVVIRTSDGTEVSQVTINGNAPTAAAGPDQTAECSNGEAVFTLDASASSDADGDSLSYRWIAPTGIVDDSNERSTQARFPFGVHTVTLEVSDGLSTSTDTLLVEVVDTVPPELTDIPVALTVTECAAPAIGQAMANDVCGVVSVTSDAPALLLLGDTTVTWTAVDMGGNTASGIQQVTAALRDDDSCCPAGTNVIHGTTGFDHIHGTDGPDCILGHGSTSFFGDLIDAEKGDDYVAGGIGRDVIEGDDGDDVIWGWEDDDDLGGWGGNDTIYGGAGDDEIDGHSGHDACYGEAGDDDIEGGSGNDLLDGGEGRDDLDGSFGDDEIYGGPGNDNLSGGSGDDILDGGGGYDRCRDGLGMDVELSCEDT